MFSGTEQLVAIFFKELAAQLRVGGKRLDAIADLAADYGGLIASTRLPMVSGVAAVGAGVGGFWQRRRAKRRTVSAQKDRLVEALADIESPIVVMIDDIDRLESAEVRDIFRLVRLVGEFPNVIYVLAFDRDRVERVLTTDGFDGRGYLDKIVGLTFDVPPLSEPVLTQLLLAEIDRAVNGVPTGPFDQLRWQDVLFRCVRPLFSNAREVKRYLAALRLTLAAMGEEVALVDVLALEALRVRVPDAHALICASGVALLQTRAATTAMLNELEEVLDASGEQAAVVREACRLLFPATEQFFGGSRFDDEWRSVWRKERRVASPQVFDFYIHGVLPPRAAAAADVQNVLERMHDERAMRAYFETLDGDVVEDLLGQLEVHLEDVSEDAVVPACTVLLDQYSRLRTASLGFLDLGPEIAVDRVVLRVLRRASSDEVGPAIRTIVDRSTSLYGRLRLLWIAGSRPNIGQGMIDAGDEDQLSRQLCSHWIAGSTTWAA